jgi:hypothetical protein
MPPTKTASSPTLELVNCAAGCGNETPASHEHSIAAPNLGGWCCCQACADKVEIEENPDIQRHVAELFSGDE